MKEVIFLKAFNLTKEEIIKGINNNEKVFIPNGGLRFINAYQISIDGNFKIRLCDRGVEEWIVVEESQKLSDLCRDGIKKITHSMESPEDTCFRICNLLDKIQEKYKIEV